MAIPIAVRTCLSSHLMFFNEKIHPAGGREVHLHPLGLSYPYSAFFLLRVGTLVLMSNRESIISMLTRQQNSCDEVCQYSVCTTIDGRCISHHVCSVNLNCKSFLCILFAYYRPQGPSVFIRRSLWICDP